MKLELRHYAIVSFVIVFFSLVAEGQEQPKDGGVIGSEHFAVRDNLKIYLWEKSSKDVDKPSKSEDKIVLLVHGSTWNGRTVFDLQIRDYSLMNFLARNGYDVWAIDIHGYGRSDKTSKDWSDTNSAVLDVGTAVEYITKLRGVRKISLLGFSWGTQAAGLYAGQNPERVGKLILFSMVWMAAPRLKGRPLPTEQYRVNSETAARGDFIEGQFETDVADKFVKEALAANPKSPNGSRVDMMTKLPMLRPQHIKVPTLVVRPEKDFATTESESLDFFSKLGTNYKSYAALPDGGHSILLEKNYRKFQDAVLNFLNQP